MSLTKSELAEMENMTEQEAKQYETYCEEQKRLEKLFKDQEERLKVIESIKFLESKGYKIEKK